MATINSGVNDVTGVEFVLTDATCGTACWQAREKVCKCSCGGANHGVMKMDNGDGKQPQRMAKIDSYRYVLHAVGHYDRLKETVEGLLRRGGYMDITQYSKGGTVYHKNWEANVQGSPVRVQHPSRQRLDSWPELKIYSEYGDNMLYLNQVKLVWVLAPDQPQDIRLCDDDTCDHCTRRYRWLMNCVPEVDLTRVKYITPTKNWY